MKTTTHYEESKGKQITNGFVATSVKTGLALAAVMIGFLVIMKFAGLADVLWLSGLNLVFLAIGIIAVIRRYTKSDGTEYMKGIRLGFITSISAVVPFALFLLVYLTMDSSFMSYIHENAVYGEFLNPISVAAIALIVGTVSGIVFTYVIMPFYRKIPE